MTLVKPAQEPAAEPESPAASATSSAAAGAASATAVQAGASSRTAKTKPSAPEPTPDTTPDSGGGGLHDATSANPNVGMVKSVVLALIISVVFYLCMLPLKSFYIGELFLARGWVPFVLVFLTAWSVAILVIKWLKVRRQRESMLLDLLPNEIGETINEGNLDKFVAHLRSQPVKPGEAMLVNRVLRGLEHFRVRKNSAEVATVLSSQSDIDANAVSSSYTLVKVFLWAIPILGFIGTVLGISEAVGGFSGSLGGDIEELTKSLNGVTGGLSTAFDTTLVALVMSILVMFPVSSLRKSEDDLLNWVDEYCNENLIRRLDDTPSFGKRRSGGGGDYIMGELIEAQAKRLEERAAEHQKVVEASLLRMSEQVKEAMQALNARSQTAQQDFTSTMERTAKALESSISGASSQMNETIAGFSTSSQGTQKELTQMIKLAADSIKTAVTQLRDRHEELVNALVDQTRQTHEKAASVMETASKNVNGRLDTLQKGILSLNNVLTKLGEEQIIIQQQPRRGFMGIFGGNKANGGGGE